MGAFNGGFRRNGNPQFALGRLKTGEMNKTEAAYAAFLEQQKQAGRILWYKFEGIKLRLADATFYTTDFFVMTAACELQAHEVKGHWQDDARAKIKIASEMYPFRFFAVKAKAKKDGGGWSYESFGGGEPLEHDQAADPGKRLL